MPAPDITTPSPGAETLGNGATYSRTLVASNTPTSWSLSGGPAGIVINNSGVMSGAPVLASPSTPAAYNITATATNGDGSDTLTWVMLVLPSVAGISPGGFVVPMDLDLATRRLSLPGIGSPQPAGNPPAGSGESAALATWVEEEKFALALGITAAGLLQDLNANRIEVLWIPAIGEPAVSLHLDASDVTETGSGSTARYQVPVYLDPDVLRNILSGTGRAKRGERVEGYLQVMVETANDARDYDETLSPQTIATLDEGDTVTKTFNVVLGSENEITETVRYTLAVALLLPSDPDNGVELSLTVSVTWNGSAFVIGDVTGSDTGTGTPSVAGTWAATLEIDSITADAEGFDVAAKVTTNTPSPTGKYVDILDTFGGYSGAFDIGFFGEANPTFVYDGITDPEIVFQGESSVVIGSPQVISNNSSREALESQFAGEIGETPSIEFRRNGSVDVMRIIFESTTEVQNVVFEGEVYAVSNYPPQPDYTNASVTCRVTGIEMPENGSKLASQLTRLDIEGSIAG